MTAAADGIRILPFDHTCPPLRIIEDGGTAVAVVWPGTGAVKRSMHHIALQPGGRTIRLRHDGEAVYYVKDGTGSVADPDDSSVQALVEGSMVHVEPRTAYQFLAGAEGMTLLGGPCPVDAALYRHL